PHRANRAGSRGTLPRSSIVLRDSARLCSGSGRPSGFSLYRRERKIPNNGLDQLGARGVEEEVVARELSHGETGGGVGAPGVQVGVRDAEVVDAAAGEDRTRERVARGEGVALVD